MSEGERVRQVRGLKTLEVFAQPLGVGGSNISNIEKSRSRLSLELAIKIAQIYEVSLDWLLLGKEPQERLAEPKHTYTASDSNQTVIDKDELIELQRLALKNTIADNEKKIKEKEENIAGLKNN